MNILLIDDHPAILHELIALIEAHEDLKVVGQAADGEEGVRLARQLHPDVIIMDVLMPGMNGIETTRGVRVFDTKVRILALSNHTSANLVKEMLNAGANGYLRKDHAYEELCPAIYAVAVGKPYISIAAARPVD